MQILYTSSDIPNNIFSFVVSYLNSDMNAVNYLPKLKKFIKCIQVKFSKLLNGNETEEFNQI